mmetsp:Transcript_7098/g.9883  ORF Transcript_7098/g.9883 Transcript_7098/m.9883 type:complete len:313 (-) Transcript_7098:121-1059(-)
MAKATLLARDYATKRRVFGDLLSEKILHLETLASLRTLYSATLHITFECILLQGRIETKETQNDIGKLHEDVLLLRLLTPVAKAYSAKIAVYVVNESMECIGGVGYLEKSGFPQLMRDSMVLPIWEGTTNVLAMDVIRVIRKHPEALDIYKKIVLKKINSALKDTDPWSKTLQDLISRVNDSLHEVLEVASDIKPNLSNQSPLVAIARDLTLMIAKVFCASCLIEHALWSKRPSDFLAAEILINQDIQDTGSSGLNVGSLKRKLRRITPEGSKKWSSNQQCRHFALLRSLALGETFEKGKTTPSGSEISSKL